MKNSVITDAGRLFGQAAAELRKEHPELTVITMNLGVNNHGGYVDTDSVKATVSSTYGVMGDGGKEVKKQLNEKYGQTPLTEQLIREVTNIVVDYLGEEYDATDEKMLEKAVKKLRNRIFKLYIADDVLVTELISHVAFFHVLDHTQLSCILRETLLFCMKNSTKKNPYRGLWYARYCNNHQEHEPELVHPVEEELDYEMDDEPDEETKRWLYAQAVKDDDENSTPNNTPWLYI